MNVALYARVSDPKEKRGTIESQIEALQAYAQANGHSVVASYVCRDRLCIPKTPSVRSCCWSGGMVTLRPGTAEACDRVTACVA